MRIVSQEVLLWNGCRFLSVRCCGIGGRLASRSGRSVAVLVGLHRRSGPSWLRRVGDVRMLGVSGVRCGCRRWNGRRSQGVIAGGESFRSIASRLGRSPSTVSREVKTNGGRCRYRATKAHRASRKRAKRPKVTKLAECPRLADAVEEKLSLWWSPGQISRWLVRAYPDDEGMRVSHETIYQSLFVQGRGALRKELWRSLRTGRAVRRPQGRPKSTKGKIRDMVMISERPAEVEESCCSWSLGRRPHNRNRKVGYWDPGGTPNPLCDAFPGSERQQSRRRKGRVD